MSRRTLQIQEPSTFEQIPDVHGEHTPEHWLP